MSPSMSPFKLESGPAAPGVRAGRGGWCAARRRRPAVTRRDGVGSSRAYRFGGALRSRTSLYLSLSSFDLSYI